MSGAAQRRHNATASDSPRELVAMLRQFAYGHRLYSVFSDFVEMSAIALSNVVDLRQRDAREARYLQIVGKYSQDEVGRFAQMLGALTLALEADVTTGDLRDVLGSVFMLLELGNDRSGQFFTPFEVSKLMAAMTLNDCAGLIDAQGFITLQEPACGAGGMVIACAETVRSAGCNYQRQMHATCIDIDPLCVHMTYLQFALLHIPAVVVHGNTLMLEIWGQWFTPAHVVGGWGTRLRARREAQIAAAPLVTPAPGRVIAVATREPSAQPAIFGVIEQLGLF